MSAESQWRIRLESDAEGSDQRASYRLCGGCWDELTARFNGSGQ